MGEQPHRAIVVEIEVVATPEAGRRRAAGRPERHRIEHLGQLVEVEVGHEQPAAELVPNRLEAPVAHQPS